jgi:hypothetical protein
MTRRDEQELRDFAHTVDVLTASALAKHELARNATGAPAVAGFLRYPRLTLAATAGLVLCVALPLYLTLPSSELHHTASRPQIALAPPPAAAPQPAAGAPQPRQEVVRGPEREAEDRRVAQPAAEAKRADEARIAELEARRRQEEERSRVARLEAARKREAEEARVAELAASERRRMAELEAERAKQREVAMALETARLEQERLRSARLPSDEERKALVMRVQEVLKRSNCYGGDVTGRSSDAQEGLDQFVRVANAPDSGKATRIELAKASVGDFETWLKEADGITSRCPAAIAAPQPLPAAGARAKRRQADGKSVPRPRSAYPARLPARSGGGGAGGVGTVQGIQ